MKKTLYLIRHGETLFNVRHKIQGWSDSPLTQNGINQALKAKQYFINENIIFDHAYCSTAERACDTLELITDIPYTRLKGLKEYNFGIFEGENEDLNPPSPYGDFFVKYGGEEQMEVEERIYNTLKNIMENDNHNSVLAVSHAGACVSFLNRCLPEERYKYVGKIKNCYIIQMEYENGNFTLKQIIDTQKN